MKKLFTMLVASVCCTMAYAQSISVDDVNVVKGGTGQVEVSIANPTNYTAFQFDLKLPAGVSVKENGAALKGTYEGDTRKLEWKLFNESTNTYRFLSYDMGNAALNADGNVVAAITVEAAETAETGDMTGGEMLVVTSDGTGTATETATGKITVSEGVKIEIGSSGKTTFVSDKALDFTGSEAVAYVVMGAEKKGDKISLWLAQIDQVPAEMPIVVKAATAGTYTIKTTTLPKTYFKNLLVGNNSDTKLSVTPEGTDLYYFLSTSGFSKFTSTREIGAHKAYVRVPALPTATVGESVPFTIGSGQGTSLCPGVDVDFSSLTNLKAYVILGWNGSIIMAPVDYASAGTPLYIKGPQGEYSVPSSAIQTVYTNMLVGNNSDEAITIHPTDGDYTNYFLSSNGFSKFSADRQTGAHKSYLQVLTSYLTEPASTRGVNESPVLNEIIVDVAKSIISDGETTGINRVVQEDGNDTWYNLSGQRISAPTKKGLYIKNGKKVIVK